MPGRSRPGHETERPFDPRLGWKRFQNRKGTPANERDEYAFERSGRVVARVSKKWFSLADTYAVDIDEGQDDVLVLAAAVVIDLVSHPDENKS
jgi:uncharacterized protein YkuJ